LSKNITGNLIHTKLPSSSIATTSEPENFSCDGVESDNDKKPANKKRKLQQTGGGHNHVN